MSPPRTFTLQTPHMHGDDVKEWQNWLRDKFLSWHIDYPVGVDGDYGQATRSATASLMRAWGVESAQDAMSEGLTAWWRSKLRRDDRSELEDKIFQSHERAGYRAALRDRYAHKDLSTPVAKILEDSWGWHPGVHDGLDLICAWKAPLLAICTGKIVRVASSGWWGLAAHASAGHPISDGDGIIILESHVNVGPFRKGMHFGYGHAEGATVKTGELVRAGQVIGHAGFANAAHVHFMVNDDPPAGGLYRGVGDRDPKPFVDYARAHS